jgi:hypothetical protein
LGKIGICEDDGMMASVVTYELQLGKAAVANWAQPLLMLATTCRFIMRSVSRKYFKANVG